MFVGFHVLPHHLYLKKQTIIPVTGTDVGLKCVPQTRGTFVKVQTTGLRPLRIRDCHFHIKQTAAS